MEKRFGFIGAGNMGGAVARTVCNSAGAENVLVFDTDREKSAAFSRETGCGTVADAAAVSTRSDFIFLCVKPHTVAAVLREISPALYAMTELEKQPVIVSIAAGVSIADIAEILGEASLRLPIIRLMPNTPLLVGKGMTLMSRCPGVSDGDAAVLETALSAGGAVLPIDEKFIDGATPVFSCSPAFVYMFIEALADGGVMAGLPRATAQQIGAQAVLGAAAMVLETGKHPGQLKDEVCSPGGSTIVGVTELEKQGFRGSVTTAVYEAYKKTTGLGKN